MNNRWQFSMHHLFAELSLLAIGLGLGRLALLSYNHNPSLMEEILFPPSLYGMLACFGAAFGGLFGRHLFGAFCAIALFFVGYSLIATGLVVYTLVFA